MPTLVGTVVAIKTDLESNLNLKPMVWTSKLASLHPSRPRGVLLADQLCRDTALVPREWLPISNDRMELLYGIIQASEVFPLRPGCCLQG